MKYFFLLFVLIILQGCFSTVNTVNKSNYQSQDNYKNIKKVMPKQKQSKGFYDIQTRVVKNQRNFNQKSSVYTGNIKGVIKNITYDKSKKAWIYEVDGLDTSYGKLPYARFYHHKKLANDGDFVYIILDHSNLKNLFFIKKINIISNRKKIRKQTVSHTKVMQRKYIGRKKMKLGVPTVENVIF